MKLSTGSPDVDAIGQLVFGEDALFTPHYWRRLVVKPLGHCDADACVILADLMNPHWIKDDNQHPVGIRPSWQEPTVVTKKKIQKWQEVYCFSPKVSQKNLARLVELGLLKKTKLALGQIKDIMTQKFPQDFGQLDVFDQVCEWCHAKTAHLHSHHYPTPKRLGGTNVVSICPNCHSEFHALEHMAAYSLTDKILEAK